MKWSRCFKGNCRRCEIQNKVQRDQRTQTRMVKSEEYGIWSQRKDPGMFGVIETRRGDDAPLLYHRGFVKTPLGPWASLREVDVCCSCLSRTPLSSRNCHWTMPYGPAKPAVMGLSNQMCHPHTTMTGQGRSIWLKQSQPNSVRNSFTFLFLWTQS